MTRDRIAERAAEILPLSANLPRVKALSDQEREEWARGQAESELARFSIVRVHRTKLANLDRVSGVDLKPSGDFELVFDNGQTLGGSRRYRPAVVSLGSRTAPAGIATTDQPTIHKQP